MNQWKLAAYMLSFTLTLPIFYVGYNNGTLSFLPMKNVSAYYNTIGSAITYKNKRVKLNTTIDPQKNKPTEPMVILITNGGGAPHPDWPFNVFSPPGKLTQEKCPLQSNCIYTHDRNYKGKIHAVLSHSYDLGWLRILKAERPNSTFVFFRLESPWNTPDFGLNMDNVFSFTATYQADSDIVSRYYDVYPIPPEKQEKKGKTVNFAEGKTKQVIIFMGHCVQYRIKFIEALRKFINVSFYGSCQADPTCKRFVDKKCEAIQKSHKFFLGMENSYCSDYVTEKYFDQGLLKGLVPIVMNGANMKSTIIAPPKSYINILDFKSTKELADHLLYLDKNDTAYNEYHQWRNEYRVEEHNFACYTCKRLWELKNEGRFGQSNVKLNQFWTKKRCKNYNDQMFQKYLV